MGYAAGWQFSPHLQFLHLISSRNSSPAVQLLHLISSRSPPPAVQLLHLISSHSSSPAALPLFTLRRALRSQFLIYFCTRYVISLSSVSFTNWTRSWACEVLLKCYFFLLLMIIINYLCLSFMLFFLLYPFVPFKTPLTLVTELEKF